MGIVERKKAFQICTYKPATEGAKRSQYAKQQYSKQYAKYMKYAKQYAKYMQYAKKYAEYMKIS